MTAQVVALLVASAGTIPFILREYSLARHESVLGAVRLNLVASFGVGVLVATVSAIAVPKMSLILLLLAAAVTLERVSEARIGISIADGRVITPSLAVAIRAAFLIAFFSLTIGFELLAPLAAYSCGRLVAACFSTIPLISVRLPKATHAEKLRNLIPRLWPFALNNSMITLRSLDTTLVTAIAGATTGGLYAAASKVLAPLTIAAGAVASALMPRVATMAYGHARRMAMMILFGAVASSLVTVPVSLLFAGPMIELVLGERYLGAAGALTWILISVPAIVAGPLLGTILQGMRRERYISFNALFHVPIALIAVSIAAASGGATAAGATFAICSVLRVSTLLFALPRPRK